MFNVSFLVSVVNKNRIRTRRRQQQAVNDTRSFSRTLEGATNRTDIESVKRLRIGGERTKKRTDERRRGLERQHAAVRRTRSVPASPPVRPSAHSRAAAKSRPVGKFRNPSSSAALPSLSSLARPAGARSRGHSNGRPNGRVESLTGRVSDGRPRPVRPPVSWPS